MTNTISSHLYMESKNNKINEQNKTNENRLTDRE